MTREQRVVALGRFDDMSTKTGLSAVTLLRLERTGSLLEWTNASFRLGVRVTTGSNHVRAAVDELRLSLDELRYANPDRQLTLVVGALAKVENEQERNRIGMALFGRQYSAVASRVRDARF